MILLLKIDSPGLWPQRHLETCKKCSLLGHTPDLLKSIPGDLNTVPSGCQKVVPVQNFHGPVVLKLVYISSSLGGLEKIQIAEPPLCPRVLGLVGMGWGPRIWISGKFVSGLGDHTW